MAEILKIPLDQRLKRLGSKAAIPFACLELFIDDYFSEAAKMCDGYKPDLWKIYESEVMQYNYRDGSDSLLTEIVHVADGLPCDERTNLLYHVLVEPFAALEDKEMEMLK